MLIKQLILISILFLSYQFAVAQQDIDEKYTHYFKDTEKVVNSELKINIKNIASRYNYFKFAFKVKNTSKDYIIYDNSKSKMVFDWGEAHLKKSKEYFLKPNKSESEVFDVNNDTRFLKEEAKFVIEGLIKVPHKGKVKQIPNTHIEKKIEADFDDVSVNFSKVDIKLKKSLVQVKVINKGTNYVLLYPAQLQVKVADDVYLKNNVSVDKVILLKPGKSKIISFSFDLLENQEYFDYKEKTISFNDFLEISKPIQLETVEFKFDLDREVTYKMNK